MNQPPNNRLHHYGLPAADKPRVRRDVNWLKEIMKDYQFRVSIIGIPKLYRIIELSENCTFDNFHLAIFDAFDRYDPHLYSFFITKADTRNMLDHYGIRGCKVPRR